MMLLERQHNMTAAEGKETSIPTIRVVLADSQPIYRMGMKKVFALEDDIRVIAQVETPSNLSIALDQGPVDVLLLEARLISGTTNAIPELIHRWPHTKFILTGAKEANTVEFYRYGVQGVIQRTIAPDLLVKCVRKVSEGETWIDNPSICRVIEDYQSQTFRQPDTRVQPKFTNKELAIINGVVAAMHNKEIAYQMGTTEQVIKNGLRKIYHKLGVSDRLELVVLSAPWNDKGVRGATSDTGSLVRSPQPIPAFALSVSGITRDFE